MMIYQRYITYPRPTIKLAQIPFATQTHSMNYNKYVKKRKKKREKKQS